MRDAARAAPQRLQERGCPGLTRPARPRPPGGARPRRGLPTPAETPGPSGGRAPAGRGPAAAANRRGGAGPRAAGIRRAAEAERQLGLRVGKKTGGIGRGELGRAGGCWAGLGSGLVLRWGSSRREGAAIPATFPGRLPANLPASWRRRPSLFTAAAEGPAPRKGSGGRRGPREGLGGVGAASRPALPPGGRGMHRLVFSALIG